MASQSGKKPDGLGRRQFLQLTGGSTLAAAAATAVVATPGSATAAVSGRTNRPADLPAAQGPRCVVVGGGASGATIAKYLKRENPDFDVVGAERHLHVVLPEQSLA